MTTTFTATIYAGFKERSDYEPSWEYEGPWPIVHTMGEATKIIQSFVDKSEGTPGGCVSVTPTNFHYVRGSEPGVCVGFINYPRFPSTPKVIKAKALELAHLLLVGLGQMKVTVVFSDETIMIEKHK